MRSSQVALLVNRRLQQQSRQQKSWRQRISRAGLGCGAVLSLLLVAGIILLGWFYSSLTSDLPSLQTLPVLLDPQKGKLMQPTTLYDRTGQYQLYTLENPGVPRRYLSLDPNLPDHISPQFIQAAVTLLDPTFWASPGFAWRGLSNLAPANLAERLVDEILLNQEAPGLRHALRMRLLAAQLVAHYGRSQVLEWYLNSAPFGHLAYGVDSAAQLYLGKPASQLDLAESTLLLAALEAPALNPLDAPAAAREKQQELLGKLLAKGMITSPEYQHLAAEKIKLRPAPVDSESPATAFSHLVIERLAARFGRQRLERGGLHIITTLDYDLQRQVSCALRNQLYRLEGNNKPLDLPDGSPCDASRLLPTLPPLEKALPQSLMGSAILTDPQTGEVLAMLGDTTLAGESPLLSSHSPGSLLSPFVALAGFARGFNPASLVWDVPSTGLPEELKGYQNPDTKYHGPQRLRQALANDYLMPLSELLYQIGPTNVWRFNEPLGLARLSSSENPAALLFSDGELSLPTLAEAYGAFANQGVQAGQRVNTSTYLLPAVVRQVEDLDGRTLLESTQPETQAVISPQLAYLVHHILSDETARWPSLGYPNALEIGRPAGAKVGQVAGGKQVWTAGYTPQRLAITWLGLPTGDTSDTQLNPKMAGGIWHAVMQYASRDLPVQNWNMPPGISSVNVCDPSGMLPTRDCPTIVAEIFLNGNEPTSLDTLYQVFQVNRETGLLATVFTPLAQVEERTYMVLPPEYQQWAAAAGIPQPPDGYDTILSPPAVAGAQINSPALFAYLHGKVDLVGSASGDPRSAGGDGFSSYYLQFGQGLNPRTWQMVAPESTQAVNNGTLAVWDTTGLDGLYALRLVVVHQNQRIDTAILQVTVDNTPPVVKVSYPAAGQTFSYPDERQISLQADIQEQVGVKLVEWTMDGSKIGETPQSPFIMPWITGIGDHTLTIKTTDLAGNVGESRPVTFVVK